MNVRLRRTVVMLLAAAVAAFAVAACGSSSNSSNGNSTSGSSSGGSSSSASSSSATGSPVTIAVISAQLPGLDFLGGYVAGAQGAADIINKQGGLAGHPVKIVTCNSMFAPATAIECAHKTLSDHVTAMLGCEPEWSSGALSIYAAAGIPSFNCANDTVDFHNKLSFGYGSGTEGEETAMIQWLCKNEPSAKTFAYVATANPEQEKTLPPVLNAVAKPCGMTVDYTWVPQTTVDLAPIVSKVLQSKPDFMGTTVSGSQMVLLAKALQQDNFPASKVSINSSAVDNPNVFKPAGSALNGVWITDEWQGWGTGSAQATAYLNALKGNSLAETGNAVQGYAVMQWIATAAKHLGSSFSASTLASYSNSANGVATPMIKSWTNPGPSEPGPQLKNPWIQLLNWNGSKMVPVAKGTDGGFVNIAGKVNG
jgi:branched-chain amino acid transport system substrate-binding protein